MLTPRKYARCIAERTELPVPRAGHSQACGQQAS
jgi:hypothetical protein